MDYFQIAEKQFMKLLPTTNMLRKGFGKKCDKNIQSK